MSTGQRSSIWPEWSIVEQIGEGSFGKVYKAVRETHGITNYAAIKMISIPRSSAELNSLKADGYDESSARSYFESVATDFVSEIKLMVTMKGTANIVSVEDYKVVERIGEIGWDIYIRMELLISFIDYTAGRKLAQDEVIKLGQDVCSALELCAQRKIIHRDIKPENIFISSFGDFKVGDFGIARELEKTSGSMSKKGTFNYIAPEITKSKKYDATVDIYSLGLLLYKMLNNNRLPFVDPHAEQILYQNQKDAITRRLSGENLPAPIDASPEMGHAILKACMYDPSLRFKTATEFKHALEAVKNGTYEIAPFRAQNTNDTGLLRDFDETVIGRKVSDKQQTETGIKVDSQHIPRTADDVNKSFNDTNEFGRSKLNKNAIVITCMICVCVIALTVFIANYFNRNGSNDEITPAQTSYISDQHTPIPQLTPDPTAIQMPESNPVQTPEPNPEAVTTTESVLIPARRFSHEWIQNEVLRIREIWQYDRAAIYNDVYSTRTLGLGVDAFYDQGQVKMIEVTINNDGLVQTRIYQFENDNLVFAYIAGGGEQNRLYFNNATLFRWRHTPDRNNQGHFTDYDDERGMEQFIFWENFALDEAHMLHAMAGD